MSQMRSISYTPVYSPDYAPYVNITNQNPVNTGAEL